jgi:hypothetical protein
MTTQDVGTIEVLLKRLPYRIKRAKALKLRVDAGELLREGDVDFLKRVFTDAEATRTVLERNPEYHKLAAQMAELYLHITTIALENEQKS